MNQLENSALYNENIAELCDEYRKKYNVIVPIDDPYELVYLVGGHIREKTDMGETVGDIKRYGNTFWITLNADLDDSCKVIAIAQMIGVLCLYTPYLKNEEEWMKYPEINIKITEEMASKSYKFAKELLMPGYLFLRVFYANIINNRINLKVLAKIFNLPLYFIKERCIDLGTIKDKSEQDGKQG